MNKLLINLLNFEIKVDVLKTNDEQITYKSSEFRNINKNNNINKLNLDINNFVYDYELNYLPYDKALKNDNRTFIDYYISLLQRKHSIIFTFYITNDYNSKFIKISLFLFSFSLYYTINTLFFNDSFMHQIYTNKSEFFLISQIPKILLSTIIAGFINTIIINLSLTESNILQLKELYRENKEKNIVNKIKRNIKIKFIVFYILNYLLLILCWYYISCFCCVYKNTQIHLLIDVLLSFSLSFINPLILCLIPGIFRIPSLKAENKDKECIYKMSKFIQFII